MATKTFGTHQPATKKDSQYYISELQKLIGVEFPLKITCLDGKVVGVNYDTEWKEGGTEPIYEDVKETVETLNKKGEIVKRKVTVNKIVDYKENYKAKKLTPEQIKKIDQWISENLA